MASTGTARAKVATPSKFDTWLDTGKKLAVTASAPQWLIGDWLVSGMDDFVFDKEEKSIYSAASQSTGYGVRTLQDLCSTARRMPATVRTVRLSYNHHRIIANGCLENKYVEWLKRAVANNLSVRKLASAIKKAAKADPSLYPPQKQRTAPAKALAANDGPLFLIAQVRGVSLAELRVQMEKEWLKDHAAELQVARQKVSDWRAAAIKKANAMNKHNVKAKAAAPAK